MRVAGAIVLCFALIGCSSPRIEAQTPGGIEIDCMAGLTCGASPQEVADMAQAHCAKNGMNAQQDTSGGSLSGRYWARYKCVGR